MQIHHLQVEKVWESVLDPRTGRIVRKSEDQLAPATTAALTYDGVQYNRDPDGSFEVPGEVGAYYLKQDGWQVGPNPFAEQIEAEHQAAAKSKTAERKADEARAKKEAAAKAAA